MVTSTQTGVRGRIDRGDTVKNIQVIDDAINAGYDIYAATDEEFRVIFPNDGQNIEFIEDLVGRIGESSIPEIMNAIWERKVKKENVQGIHGTLFYGLINKKKYYENKMEPVINWKFVD